MLTNNKLFNNYTMLLTPIVLYFSCDYIYKRLKNNNNNDFYINSIKKYLDNNNNNNNNNNEINIIITFNNSYNNSQLIKDLAKIINNHYSNNNNNKKTINIFSIEYSEIEHYNETKDKFKFDAIILLDSTNNNNNNNDNNDNNESTINKFNKIIKLLKPSATFLTFYTQSKSLNNNINNNNNIVNWSSNIIENKIFYELCGFSVDGIIENPKTTAATVEISDYLVISRSPEWYINSKDNLSL